MASIADDLGVSESAIYYHFPSKGAVLLAIGERTMAELRLPAYAGDWRQWLMDLARTYRALLLRYPFLLDQDVLRQIAGPANWRRSEELLEQMEQAGFTGDHALDVLGALVAITLTYSRIESDIAFVDRLPTPGEMAPRLDQTARIASVRTVEQHFEAAVRVVIDGAGRSRRAPRRASRGTG